MDVTLILKSNETFQFATVYKARDVVEDNIVAVKKVCIIAPLSFFAKTDGYMLWFLDQNWK